MRTALEAIDASRPSPGRVACRGAIRSTKLNGVAGTVPTQAVAAGGRPTGAKERRGFAIATNISAAAFEQAVQTSWAPTPDSVHANVTAIIDSAGFQG